MQSGVKCRFSLFCAMEETSDSKKPHFSAIPSFWTGFRPVSVGMAKTKFCNIEGIFSG